MASYEQNNFSKTKASRHGSIIRSFRIGIKSFFSVYISFCLGENERKNSKREVNSTQNDFIFIFMHKAMYLCMLCCVLIATYNAYKLPLKASEQAIEIFIIIIPFRAGYFFRFTSYSRSMTMLNYGNEEGIFN